VTGPLIIALAIGVIFIAAIVRGYSGFGFAMIGVAGISLTAPPDVAIPTVLILEVIVGLLLLPPVIRQIEWRPVLTLLAGAIVLTPIGAIVLIRIPADLARVGIAIVIALAAILLLRSKGTRPAPGDAATVGVGGIAGLLNGAFGISGPPIALFFLGTERGAHVSRASMMACFLALDLVAVASFGVGGLIDRDVLITVLFCLPALAIGSWIGHRLFHGSDTSKFRTRVLWILLVLALVTAARGLAGLL
jgi:uncharacterized membrane protein YfcA